MRVKILTALFCAIVITACVKAQNPLYDSVLAKKYGADSYGMKGYMLVILKTGSNTNTDKAFLTKSFDDHLKNIGQLVKEGKMIVAGPLRKNEKNYRGIFILNTGSKEEAEKWLEADPAITEKILEAEYYNWYGSAALPAYLEDSDKIWKEKP